MALFSLFWEKHLEFPPPPLWSCVQGSAVLSKEDLSPSILGAKRIMGAGGWGCHPSSWPRSSAQPAAGLGLSPQIAADLGVPGAEPLGQVSLWQSCTAGAHPATACPQPLPSGRIHSWQCLVEQGRGEPTPSFYLSFYSAVSFGQWGEMGSGGSGEFVQQHLAPGLLMAARGVLSGDTPA